MEMAQNNHRRPLLRQHLLEARHPFAVTIQNQDLVEFWIKLLDPSDDASRASEIATPPVCVGRRLCARGRKNFVENIAQKLKVLLGDMLPNHVTTSSFTANSLKSGTPAACALALSTLSGARPDRPIV